MIHPELYLRIAKQRIQDMLRGAEQWRLLLLSPQPTWLTQQIRWLMRWLGRWLIRMSQPPQQQDRCQHEQLTP